MKYYQLKVQVLDKYKLYKELKYIDTPNTVLLPQPIETSNGNITYKSESIDMEYTNEITLSITGNCILLYNYYK